MDNRIYLWDLYNEEDIPQKQKQFISKNPYYNLELIPSPVMREEIAEYIRYRSTKVCAVRLYGDLTEYQKICGFLQAYGTKKGSLKDKDTDTWMRQMKMWMFREQIPMTVQAKSITGKIILSQPRFIGYFKRILKHLEQDERPEREKDIWELAKLDIPYRDDPTRRTRTLNFTKIKPKTIREEIKKGIYLNLQSEAMDCIQKELTAMRRFSKYLLENYPEVQSCKDINRPLIEEYLTYLKTEQGDNRRLHSELDRLRKILETTGQILGYPHLCSLFLTRDIPPTPKAEYKAYSDTELKRLNAAIVKMNEQDARLLIIHQMLGTRISDAILLEPDCLSQKNGEIIIRIHQMKTRYYEKPISEELAALIQKAIEYTQERYGDVPYIFVDERNPTEPMQYGTLQTRVTKMIYEEDLRDDNEELFGFNTHMFRHCYGRKLTEMHLDDWTIAKLLGHSGVRNVKFYRKMSNQLLADETRKARHRLSEIILNNLDGWEDEYEQIRQDAFLK